jgi:hypothetical protein
MWEVGLPSSHVEFSSLCHSDKLSRSWLQSLSGPPGLFIYSPGKDSLPPIFSTQCAPPSFPRIFIVLIAYYSVSLFSPGGVQSVQGAMLSGPGLFVGEPRYHEAHLVRVFPSHLGTGDWWHGRLAARGPSLFLCLM